MNNESTRVFLALFVYGSMVLSLACARDNTSDPPEVDKSSLCPDGATFTQKKGNIEGYITQKLPGLTKLQQQKGERFHYEIVSVTSKELLEVKITGLLRDRGKQETTFEDFLDIIDTLMMKKCIDRVTFNKGAYLPNSLTSDGFEWQACEYPNVYCADGECRQTCVFMDPGPPPTNTSNSNANSNTNTNANSNSNSRNGNY